MKNENNVLNLRSGSFGVIVDLKEGITVFIPTVRSLANARVLKTEKDGSTSIHWKSNWNLSGDFRTELMRFDSNLILNNGDKKERNKIRKANGLVEIK